MNFHLKLGPFNLSVGKSAVSPAVAGFLSGSDLDDDGSGTRLVTPYSQSAWVYTAVSILASHVAQIPFRISRMDCDCARRVRALRGSEDARHKAFRKKAQSEGVIESGAAVDLFDRPHPTMNRQLFWEMVVTWNCLRGEFFIVPLDNGDQPVDISKRSPRVQRMLTLDTGLFWHKIQGYELEAWRYTGSPLLSPLPSEMLLPGEVIHSRTPNPYFYWRGMSPLLVAGVAAQTDFAGEQFQKGLWVNNADTGIIVTTDQPADDVQQKQILAALNERKRKAGTADRPLFLWGGAKVEKPTLTMMDMQFLETRNFLRAEIFSIFKVPEPLAGFTAKLNDGGAGGSLDAVKISFVESTLGALCEKLECAVDPIVKSFGEEYVGWFDLDSLPIMQAARRTRWDTATKMFGMGVPMADINMNLDLGLPDQPWYKNGYLPFSVQVAGEPAEPLPSEGEDVGTPMAAGEKSNPFSRMLKLLRGGGTGFQPVVSGILPETGQKGAAAVWRKRMTFRRAHEKLFAGKISKVLMKFRQKTLSKLDEVHLQKSAGQISWESRGLIDLIFNAHAFGTALNEELSAPIASVLQASGEAMHQEIGFADPWKYPQKQKLEYLAGRTQRIVGAGTTLRDQLNTTLVEGVTNGETHDELAARVKEVFGDMADSDARRIARTEVNSAATNGAFTALGDAGVEYKSWLGSHGPHARPEHQAVEDATIGDPIPVDEPFEVDGEHMRYPLDDSLGASAGNIINCQCDVLAAKKTSEDEKSVTFKIFGIGEMKFVKKL